jgi:hypothetical protein
VDLAGDRERCRLVELDRDVRGVDVEPVRRARDDGVVLEVPDAGELDDLRAHAGKRPRARARDRAGEPGYGEHAVPCGMDVGELRARIAVCRPALGVVTDEPVLVLKADVRAAIRAAAVDGETEREVAGPEQERVEHRAEVAAAARRHGRARDGARHVVVLVLGQRLIRARARRHCEEYVREQPHE